MKANKIIDFNQKRREKERKREKLKFEIKKIDFKISIFWVIGFLALFMIFLTFVVLRSI